MKDKKTETEYANLKINEILNDENESNTVNNIALVFNGQDTRTAKNENNT